MPWFKGGAYLPDLKLERQAEQGTTVPIFKVQFSSPDGFALYYLEFFDGYLDADWSIEGNEPRLPRAWLLIKPELNQCQSNIGGARFSFDLTGKDLEIQVDCRILEQFFSGLLIFMSGDFVASHQVIVDN